MHSNINIIALIVLSINGQGTTGTGRATSRSTSTTVITSSSRASRTTTTTTSTAPTISNPSVLVGPPESSSTNEAVKAPTTLPSGNGYFLYTPSTANSAYSSFSLLDLVFAIVAI